MNLPETVNISFPAEGYPVFEVRNSHATARVALHGAHVLSWQPEGREPVLYLSPDAVLEEGKAVRGGIPVCWPWFNAHPTDPTKPAHGIARNRFWEVDHIEELDEGTELVFRLQSSDETLKLWPHHFHLTLRVVIGASLTLELETRNAEDAGEFTVGGALHTYLTVGDLSRIQVRGLDDATYTDTVGEPSRHDQSGMVEFDEEVDRIYYSPAALYMDDPAQGRTIVVEKEGSNTSVVWNPWVEKSRKLADLPNDGFHNFVCLETANAEDDVRALPAGSSHKLVAKISVVDL